ncbi:MAG: heme exporter protein CcmB [Rickettsiales bacterium]|nr:heme exporter protein CcmB [Rickettsiales bacterium]
MFSIVKRDFILIYKRPSELINILMFFFLMCFILSFSAPDILKENFTLSYSIIIISMILACGLNQDIIFERDLRIGFLTQFFLNIPAYKIILSKIISNFLLFSLPIAIISPISALFFGIKENIFIYLIIGASLSGLVISSINILFASLVAGVRNGGVASAILSLPIYISLIVANFSYAESLVNSEFFQGLANLFSSCLAFLLIIIPIAIFSGKVCLERQS